MTATPNFLQLVGQIMADRPGWQEIDLHRDPALVSYTCQDSDIADLKLVLDWRDEHAFDWHNKPMPARLSVNANVEYPIEVRYPRTMLYRISMAADRPLAMLRRDFESRLLTPFMADIVDFRAIIARTEADIVRLNALVVQMCQWYPAFQAPEMIHRFNITVRLYSRSSDVKATILDVEHIDLQLGNLTPTQIQAVLEALHTATPLTDVPVDY